MKDVRRTVIILLLLALVLLPAQQAFAQSAETDGLNSAEITFEAIDEATISLQENESGTVSFDIPARWQIEQANNTNYLIVNYDVNLSNVEGQTIELPPESNINVLVNSQFVASLPLADGTDQQARIALPAQLFADPDQTNYSVQFELNYGYACLTSREDIAAFQASSLYMGDIAATIHDTSSLQISYEIAPPSLILSEFPAPFGDNSLDAIILPIVIADDADRATIEAAAAVAATVGAAGGQIAGVEFMTVSQAEQGALAGRDAILLGLQNEHALIDSYDFTQATENSDAGLLQYALSEDEANVYLLISGETPAALHLATQALSLDSNNAMLGLAGAEASVDQVVNAGQIPFANSEILPLSQLNYNGRLYSGRGSQTSAIAFFVPANWELTENPRLSLTYSASNALTQGASGLTVRLNRQPISSVQAENASLNPYDLTIEIPKEDIRLGEVNRLAFTVANRVEQCNVPDEDLVWSRILDNGSLYLPHQEADITIHDDPIKPLLTSLDLSDVVFATAEEPTATDLEHLMQLAWTFGRKSAGSSFSPSVVFGEISQEALSDNHLVLIGEPSRNPAFTYVNDALPQPFEIESNTLLQQVGNVTFELPSDYRIGIIESIAAPWNGQRSATIVSGTSPEGVAWAVNAITDAELAGQIDGNVSFVREDVVTSIALTPELTEQITVEEINKALAETNPIEKVEAVVEPAVETAPEPTLPELVEVVEVQEEQNLQDLVLGGDYSAPPTSIPTGVRQTAFTLLGIALFSALLGIFLVWRRQNNLPPNILRK